MVRAPDGWAIPAGGTHLLQRGGDHVMFTGMNPRPEMGDVVTLTLTFEKADDVSAQIVVGAPAGTVPMSPAQP
ncbi:copper chaperone PCu(A)C [Phaeovulum sp.]|uniref:copper chaperone PCu(A)C n=1 Tax=Phaeovulum sp. TaxID=2934796 RepID=UPI003569457E